MIQRRLRDAASDMSHWAEFDYVVVNADFAQALAELHSIVLGQGEALRAGRTDLQPVISELLAT